MKRKRFLADSVLWPQESDDREIQALYDAIVGADEATSPAQDFQGFNLADYPDLKVQDLGSNTIRISPNKGGASILVSTDCAQLAQAHLMEDDAVAVLLADQDVGGLPKDIPVSILNGTVLWPEFILLE